MVSADQTSTLELGYWPSYNVPFFREVLPTPPRRAVNSCEDRGVLVMLLGVHWDAGVANSPSPLLDVRVSGRANTHGRVSGCHQLSQGQLHSLTHIEALQSW